MSVLVPSLRAAIAVPQWSKNELWRRARAVPSLDLRFADNKSLVDATTGQNLVTFSRASSGTYVDIQGVIRTALDNEPRFDHNPTTGESLGLLVEESRQNLLLNSGTLSTQNVTVTAVAHTLSFTGTGTITLSGTSTAGPLVGTGTGEANRVSLTFTPTAGTLTLTVSGTVTNAQLEIGAFRTSYIPTSGTTAPRAADVASISGSNLTSWYRQDEGTVFAEAIPSSTAGNGIVGFDDGTNNERWRVGHQGTNAANFVMVDGGVVQVNTFTPPPSWPVGASGRIAGAVQLNNSAVSNNGQAFVEDLACTLPTVTQMTIGTAQSTAYANARIRRLTYWPQRLGNEVLQRITQ